MKTNENQLLDKLTVILRKYAGEESNIESNTQIEADLSITGDDAYDLINELRKEFMLDISAFDFNKYFCPEPNTLWVIKVVSVVGRNPPPPWLSLLTSHCATATFRAKKQLSSSYARRRPSKL